MQYKRYIFPQSDYYNRALFQIKHCANINFKMSRPNDEADDIDSRDAGQTCARRGSTANCISSDIAEKISIARAYGLTRIHKPDEPLR